MNLFKGVYSGIPKKYVILDFIGVLIWTLFQVGFIELLSNLTSEEIITSGRLPAVALLYALYIILWECIEFGSDYVHQIALGYLRCTERIRSFNLTYKTKSSILKKNNTGYISGLVNQLVNDRKSVYSELTISLFLACVYVTYFIIRMSFFHIAFSISMLCVLILGVSVRVIGNFIAAKYKEKAVESESLMHKIFIDSVSNINTVKKMNAKDFINSKMKETEYCIIKTISDKTLIDEAFFCTFKILMFSLAPVCLIVYSFIQSDLTCDTYKLFSLIALVSNQFVHIAKDLAICVRECNNFSISDNKVNNILSKENEDNIHTLTSFNKVEIKDLEYSYKQNDSTVRVNIPNFEVCKGDKVCIYGESGQGKTTTLNVLSRELETNNVFIDGVQSPAKLNYVFVSQDTEMLDMSLYDNLTMGRNISEQLIIDMIERTGLGEWYYKQPNGLDTLLGERGVFVSTGQRQRLNLIRGLLQSEGDVYLLDEPTSNVDEVTENSIINLIKEVLNDKTVIIVSHRPAIKRICNKEYEFVNGTIYLRK